MLHSLNYFRYAQSYVLVICPISLSGYTATSTHHISGITYLVFFICLLYHITDLLCSLLSLTSYYLLALSLASTYMVTTTALYVNVLLLSCSVVSPMSAYRIPSLWQPYHWLVSYVALLFLSRCVSSLQIVVQQLS